MSIEKTLMTDENIFGFLKKKESNIVNALTFEELQENYRQFLSSEVDNADSTDGVFQALTSLSEQFQEEFDELVGEDIDKKRFVKSLSKISAALLIMKVHTVQKIKKIIKIALETTVKIWSGKRQ